ncbi:unnamed protein product [Rotaria socialis]|uniref:Uncharacterized protein n=1 Tax=Rotaria socialis TaxID=392032 RepID=A0A820Q793_9BILA|nr:unnamed protein product [Rotaria socialis]CAF3679221.1 unnamed protein product [Rotaria socialis]CAF4416959.1 unnamed protein product [Rotaria socialis]CAF4858246.1 unnamed protein product [Rotaria socialis]
MNKITLKVALYPFIPDAGDDNNTGLLQFITDEFNKVYPDIALQLRPLSINDNFYDLDLLSKWLMADGTGYDIVEIDAVLLGDLVNIGLVAPQFINSTNQADWHTIANMAVHINNAVYGFPHLMCAYFLFTRDVRIATVSTIDQLMTILGDSPTDDYRLAGNMDSSWGLPALWINSYQGSSNSSAETVAYALHGYTKSSFENILKLAGLCNRSRGENHCLDGTFRKYQNMPAILFAQNKTTAMFAYSEQLFYILKDGNLYDYNNIKLIPLPIGTAHNQPLFFTDAFVFRRNMSADVLNASRLFAEFMGTPRMQAVVVGSGDKPGSIPRYLLPMSKSAYDDPLLANNRFYQTYFRNLTGFSFPTVGLLNTRKQLQTAILDYIGYTKTNSNTSSSISSSTTSVYEGFWKSLLADIWTLLSVLL